MNNKLYISILARGMVYVSGYVYLLMTNKLLEPEIFGRFIFSQALAEMCLVIFNSGASNYYARATASSISKLMRPSLYDIVKIGFLPGAALFIILYNYKYKWDGLEVYFFFAAIALQAVNSARMGYLKGCGEFVYGNIEPSIRALVTSALMFLWMLNFGYLDILAAALTLVVSNLIIAIWIYRVTEKYNTGPLLQSNIKNRIYLTAQSILSFIAKKSDILLFSVSLSDSSIGRLKILLIFSEIPYQFFQNYLSTKVREISASEIIVDVLRDIAKKAVLIYICLSIIVVFFIYFFKDIVTVPVERELLDFFPMMIYFFIKMFSSMVETTLMYKSKDRMLILFSICEATIKIATIITSIFFAIKIGEIYLIMATLEFSSAYLLFFRKLK